MMSMPAETRATLLLRIRDPRNTEAWREFIAIYEPLIGSVGRRFGLQNADADELTQEVLMTVLQKQDQYTPNGQQGSFRRWLATVARNAAVNKLRKMANLPSTGDSGVLQRASQHADHVRALEQDYEREEQNQLLSWAADQVRSRTDATTWSAFWLSFIEQRSIEDTAKQLRISTGQVYVARCRVLKRLRESVQLYTSVE